jgi:hypothetical protein
MKTLELITAAFVFACVALPSAAGANEFFRAKGLNASQQAKVSKALAQGRRLGSEGTYSSLARGSESQGFAAANQAKSQVPTNDRSCTNDAASVNVPKGYRGKVEPTTVVKGDVIMVCKSR